MLAEERHRRIVETVERDGSARVRDLAVMLDVTEETIRRDLEKLEAENLLIRRRGGALALTHSPLEMSFTQREIMHPAEKQSIARLAMELIRPGETIFLDASTTSLNIARMLPNEEYVVLTYAYHVMGELMRKPRIRLVCIGGTLDRPSQSFVGPSAEQNLERYHVARAFHSCTAWHMERGATEANEFQASLKKIMIRNARENYLLADSSKFGHTSLTHFAMLEEFTGVITDSGLPREPKSTMKAKGVRLELASA